MLKSLMGMWRTRPPLGRRAAMLAAPCFAGGAGAYVTLPFEPDRWAAVALTLAAALLLALLWRLDWGRWPAFWLLSGALGFCWSMASADWAAAPRLERQQAGGLSGRVAWIEMDDAKPRATLDQATFQRRGKTLTLKRARVRLAGGLRPAIGDRISVKAIMQPPPAPVVPGGYDFQRQAYFDGVGAVGYAIGPVTILAEGAEDGAWFAKARAGIRAAIYRALPDRPGIAGIVTALTVGDRSGVGDADNAALRASGLAHLLAISGLHLGMAAGLVYLALRLLFALPHGLALRTPAHKWAAACAILAAAVYLGLSGAAPPAQRAFVMIVAAMLAVLTDRLRSGLWFVAWGAVVVTLVAPNVVAGPSFQLSFAAATGIVAAYEAMALRRRERDEPAFARFGRLRAPIAYLAGILGASLIATLATAPLALAHFQQAPAYGALANLAAMPAMAFIIMPMAILAGVLAPIGLAEWPIQAMALGVESVVWTAHQLAALPGGVIRAPAAGHWPPALFLLGGAWFCAVRGWPRALGLVAMLAACSIFAFAKAPDVLASGEGRLAAIAADGTLYVTTDRSRAFERKVWAQQTASHAERPLADAPPAVVACDDRGCAARIGGRTVALSTAPAGLPADCREADIVIALHRLRATAAMGCDTGQIVIDQGDFWRAGAHALWIEDGGVRIETVRARQGARLWSGWRHLDQ